MQKQGFDGCFHSHTPLSLGQNVVPVAPLAFRAQRGPRRVPPPAHPQPCHRPSHMPQTPPHPRPKLPSPVGVPSGPAGGGSGGRGPTVGAHHRPEAAGRVVCVVRLRPALPGHPTMLSIDTMPPQDAPPNEGFGAHLCHSSLGLFWLC